MILRSDIGEQGRDELSYTAATQNEYRTLIVNQLIIVTLHFSIPISCCQKPGMEHTSGCVLRPFEFSPNKRKPLCWKRPATIGTNGLVLRTNAIASGTIISVQTIPSRRQSTCRHRWNARKRIDCSGPQFRSTRSHDFRLVSASGACHNGHGGRAGMAAHSGDRRCMQMISTWATPTFEPAARHALLGSSWRFLILYRHYKTRKTDV